MKILSNHYAYIILTSTTSSILTLFADLCASGRFSIEADFFLCGRPDAASTPLFKADFLVPPFLSSGITAGVELCLTNILGLAPLAVTFLVPVLLLLALEADDAIAVDLDAAAMSLPAVLEAAVFGAPLPSLEPDLDWLLLALAAFPACLDFSRSKALTARIFFL